MALPVVAAAPSGRTHPGAADCERLRPGLIAQPANTWSSLAYVATGSWLVVRGARRPAGRRLPPVAFGLVVAANGLGGLAFHGPGRPWARWLHDVALTATLAFVAARGLVDATDAGRPAGIAATGTATTAAGLLLAAVPDATNAVTGTLGAAVVGTELLAERRTRRLRRGGSRRQVPYAVAGGALLVGAGVNLLSRTGRPWCRPDGVVQGHAVWHVLTAVGLAAWGEATLGGRRVRREARRSPG